MLPVTESTLIRSVAAFKVISFELSTPEYVQLADAPQNAVAEKEVIAKFLSPALI
jgi:hypothetical protein